MRPPSPATRFALLACALALGAAATPAAAQMDCLPPGSEEYASAPICNFEPMVIVTPPTTQVGQPRVPVTIEASDHWSDQNFASFKIVLDNVNVTPLWTVTTKDTGSGTGVKRTFTSSGLVTLSPDTTVRTLMVELCDLQFCTQQISTFTLRRPGVEVGKDGLVFTVLPAATRTTTFTVYNRGTSAATFAVAAECRNVADGSTVAPCSVSPASVPLAPGDSTVVTATFPAAQSGNTVNVLVRATQTDAPGVQDAGWSDAVVRANSGTTGAVPAVALAPMNAGATIERSECATIATAVEGAYECGDLRVSHALPAHRTRGRTWAPVLLYNSQLAHPRPTVYADVTVPAGAAAPTTVEMVVTMASGVVHRATFSGNGFLPGMSRRIGVQWDGLQTPTGLYGYTLQVTSHYPAGPQPAPAIQGEIAVVNYATVYYGAGWWVAGVERIHCVTCSTGGSRTLWVGGDGSTRVYEPASPGSWTYWVAQNPDRSADTLVLGDSGYVRKLPNGGAVYFNSAGLHYKTVNRLGQTTRFTYNAQGLDAIHAPGGGPGTGGPSWTFNWDLPANLVRSFTAIAPGAPSRTTKVTHDASKRVTAFTDPDSVGVTYTYGSTTGPNLIMRQRDRRGTTVFYSYNYLHKLNVTRLQMGPNIDYNADPVSQFSAAEVQGVAFDTATAAKSVATAQAYTWISGPRSDVNDVTFLWHNRNGYVNRVRDPLGNETYVQHDTRFPALPVQVRSPGGRISRAHYDFRGRVDTATVVNVFADGRDRVTTYRYDDRWNAPVSVASYQVYPGGSWTLLSARDTTVYDAANGNVLWTQKGSDAGRRVNFSYYASGTAAGQLASVRSPSGVPGQTARDSLIYDANGNLAKSISPLGFVSLVYRDALGRDTLSVTPTQAAQATTDAGVLASGVRQRTRYDTMDRPVRTATVGQALTHADASGLVPMQTGVDTLVVMTEYDNGGLPLEVLRYASPDTARVHILSTAYTYDAAGRKRTETDAFARDSFAYNMAGHQVLWKTQRGHIITSQYDALGRMVRQVIPQVSYSKYCPSQTNPCQNPYPHHPNGPGGSLVIPEEWVTFRYDSVGSMVYAENADAIIRRTYYRDGSLQSDSLSIRSLNGVDFTASRYGLTYGYNLAGSVSSMQHPTNLATTTGQQWDQFAYDPVTGALAAMTDRRGHYFEFHHNYAGQMTSLRGPAYTDSMRYDLEGRLHRRVETALAAGVLHDDSLTYDARGKLLRADVKGGTDTYRQWYSGIGMLIGTDWSSMMHGGRLQEAFGMDALGNVAWRRSGDGGGDPSDIVFRHAYDPGVGRLTEIESVNLGIPSNSFYPERTTRTYDLSGNMQDGVLEQMGELGYGAGIVRDKRSRSFYGADERLRYFQERDLRGGNSVQLDGVWEEYRYDPLGRRVLVNTRTKDLCTSGTAFQCASATTRMVWAGDQLLWEMRGASGSSGETSGPGSAYGTVSYTHALGIDRPLVITRDGQSILPHANWRGQFAAGTNTSGAKTDCPPGVTTGCTAILWPGFATNAWHMDVREPDIRNWWGGLVNGMKDVTGQMYMRNRYYDPATGQFTQKDPIGIAGGLNTYGFAAGDPITYSDPYGLFTCPGDPGCPPTFGEGPLDRFMNNLSLGVSGTLGNRSISASRRNDGVREVSEAHVLNAPSLGASVDVGWNRQAPAGTQSRSVDIGVGKHLGVSVNIAYRSDRDWSVTGVTGHIGGSTPTIPVGISYGTSRSGSAPRGSVRRERQRLNEESVSNRVY